MVQYSDNPNDWFNEEQVYDQEYRFSHGDGCRRKGESPDVRGRLFVVRRRDGWRWTCFNCGQSGFKKDKITNILRNVRYNITNDFALRDSLKKYETVNLYNSNIIQELESVFNSQEALQWLNKYNITKEEIERFCCRVKNNNRLGLLIYDQDSVVKGIQWRNLKQDKYPKYLTEYVEDYKLGSWFNAGQKTVVIVEDILSGIVLARNPELSVVALLGSPAKLPQNIIDKILQFDKIIVWLDSDKIKTALDYQKRLRALYDKDCEVIFRDGDPKDQSNSMVREILRLVTELDSSSNTGL